MPQAPGIFRRRILAVADGQVVRGGVADEFHHYEVDLRHDGQVVLGVEARSIRVPWKTCPGAMAPLHALEGAALGTDVWRRKGLPDPHLQCTHMYELALFAMAQAVRGGRRQYDLAVPDREGIQLDAHAAEMTAEEFTGATSATLARDGQQVLDWTIEGVMIQPPSPYAGLSITQVGGVAAKTETDDDVLEAVKLLRRSVHVALGRALPRPKGAWMHKSTIGACYAFQPERVNEAWEQPGSRLDLTTGGEGLLAHLGARDYPEVGTQR